MDLRVIGYEGISEQKTQCEPELALSRRGPLFSSRI